MIKLKNTDFLLFQGDSITHGGRVQSTTDMNHIMGHGYQSILASRIGFENLDTRPGIKNRGISGDTVPKLAARWDEDTLALKPTILSILIGVNDCYTFLGSGSPKPEDYNTGYRALLDRTVAALPDIKLIICEPFCTMSPRSVNDEEARKNDAEHIDVCREYAAYAREIAKDYGAVFVPFWGEIQKYFDICPIDHIVWDGVHPTYVGHEIMARFWYDTVDRSGLFGE